MIKTIGIRRQINAKTGCVDALDTYYVTHKEMAAMRDVDSLNEVNRFREIDASYGTVKCVSKMILPVLLVSVCSLPHVLIHIL